MCCARLHATFPHRKDVAFIKAKHGKGAVQNSRHTHSGGAQRAASLWKQVLLTLLIFIALLALLGGALGLVKGALLVFLAVWVLQKLQLLVTPELVDKTVLLKFFARNSPIDLIAKL